MLRMDQVTFNELDTETKHCERNRHEKNAPKLLRMTNKAIRIRLLMGKIEPHIVTDIP